jgi:hypothetical protein
VLGPVAVHLADVAACRYLAPGVTRRTDVRADVQNACSNASTAIGDGVEGRVSRFGGADAGMNDRAGE